MSSAPVINVAVENTAYSFDREFSYIVPASLADKCKPGCRVTVPFGRGNRTRQAIVTGFSDTKDTEKLKSIKAVIDDEPVINNDMLKTAFFMKEQYYCTLYNCVKTMLPAGINYKVTTVYGANPDEGFDLQGEEARIYAYLHSRRKPVKKSVILDALGLSNSELLDKMAEKKLLYKSDEAFRRVSDAVMKMVAPSVQSEEELTGLTEKQKRVMETLLATGGASIKEVCYFTGVTSSVIDALCKKGAAHCYDEEVFRIERRRADKNISELVLSDEQQRACDGLYAEYLDDRAHTSLLYGVTGSGKTSVFMKLIERVIHSGRGIIVMVPEIALTPQFVEGFSKRFGEQIAVFHSALSLGERLDEYKRVKNGSAKIAIGTRSAVFAPFENIGLIIMDEEQEYSYKSEKAPRYHAREIAGFRCAQNKALLLLSSATPSVETFYYAKQGRYSLYRLSSRYGEARLPQVCVADMNEEVQNGNASGFSEVLLENLAYNLEHGRQSILLLNRRGHNSFVTCRVCGEPLVCPNCSISLTYHSANGRLMCHYCGYSVLYGDECPKCHGKTLRAAGTGTQKAEKDIARLFPSARILRMDADAASSKSSYEKMISAFSRGEYDILLGTQMVAKGLDFPNVTLVGVLNTDRMLYADDYRSYERSFSLLTQVVGRSGRGRHEGLAVIQSYTPDNLIIAMAARQDYEAFFNTEISMRKAMLYPPFSDICLVGFVSANKALALRGANEFLKLFVSLAKSEYSTLPIRILGPSPAAVIKVSNKFRYKLIIKCRNTRDFRRLLSSILVQFGENKEFSGVTAFADMNALVC